MINYSEFLLSSALSTFFLFVKSGFFSKKLIVGSLKFVIPLISLLFTKGKIGEFYNIGSNKNLNNLEICKALLKISKKNHKIGANVKIKFVKDRPGHDFRYALDSNKIKKKLKWYPKTSFEEGIKLTLDWYNNNKTYYKSLSKKDIIKRLGKQWLKKELY